MRHRALRAAGVALGVMVAVVTLAACGGGGDGEVKTKAQWQEKNRELLDVYDQSLNDARDTLNTGERASVLRGCNQLNEDATEFRKEALPVPNAQVQGALVRSLDLVQKGVESCRQGGQGSNAHAVETSMAELDDARKALDEAISALEAWS